MKFTINVDCTPEEARSFLGLPDLTPLHDKYLEQVAKAMENAGSVEQMEAMMRSFSPMGDAGMKLFRQMMELGTAGMGGSSKS